MGHRVGCILSLQRIFSFQASFYSHHSWLCDSTLCLPSPFLVLRQFCMGSLQPYPFLALHTVYYFLSSNTFWLLNNWVKGSHLSF